MLNVIGDALAQNNNALPPASYAAGVNNGPWIDIRTIEGQIVIPINVGAVTGSVVFSLSDASDGSGTGAAPLSPAVATASISTANSAAKLVVNNSAVRGWLRVVATVTTGPVFASANIMGHPGTI